MTARPAPLDPASPIPLWIGIGMALAAMLAALLVLATFSLADFPAIAQACELNRLDAAGCTAGAWRVGVFACGAYAVVLAAGVAIHRRSARGTAAASVGLPETAVRVVLLAAFGVVLVHLLAQVAGPAFASRSDESLHYGALISIENLLWPLLLQLYVSQPDMRLRAAVLATLLAIMALSPYRSALLAIMTFGFAVPLVASLWQANRAGWPRPLALGCVRQAALAIAIGAVVAWGGYVGTVTRFPSMLVVDQFKEAQARARERPAPVEVPRRQEAEPQASAPAAPSPAASATVDDGLPSGTVTAPPPAALVPRFAQRIAFPLYQAAIVEKLATLVPLPSLSNELGRKFRLTSDPTLEEFLFRRIYGGEGPDQTTSLYFGEAVAYFPGPPLVWMVVGPLLLVLAALFLRRAGVPSSTTLGVALWRSSFSGLAPILPALLLQLATLVAMGWSGRRPVVPLLQRAVRHLLTVVMAAALVVQVWAVAATPARRTLVIANFAMAPHCVLVSPTWVSTRTDQALAAAGLSARSSLAWTAGDTMAVTLPLGARSEPELDRIAGGIATLVECPAPEPGQKVSGSVMRRFPAMINPLDVLAAFVLAIALLATMGPSFGRARAAR
jgi:hypothetical protein